MVYSQTGTIESCFRRRNCADGARETGNVVLNNLFRIFWAQMELLPTNRLLKGFLISWPQIIPSPKASFFGAAGTAEAHSVIDY